jgi:hypothetical protein
VVELVQSIITEGWSDLSPMVVFEESKEVPEGGWMSLLELTAQQRQNAGINRPLRVCRLLSS